MRLSCCLCMTVGGRDRKTSRQTQRKKRSKAKERKKKARTKRKKKETKLEGKAANSSRDSAYATHKKFLGLSLL